MYAQCPNCLTFFHLKPSHLKAANGRVRCSRCKHVFNALDTLRDEVTPEEIAAVEDARKRDLKPDAPLLNEEYAGDLFDGLDYTKNEELGLDTAEPGGNDAPPPFSPDPLTPPARGLHDFAAPRRRTRHPVLLSVAIFLLLLALAAQVAHWQRERILEHPLAGAWLARGYAALDITLEPPRNLAALQVSRTEVSSHPDEPRALLLTAMLENTGNTAQPWPDLRVDLQDRWGETVGARFFGPREYLRDTTAAEQAIPPQGRFAISLAIMDPGNDAVGFRIDPCFATGGADERRHACASHLSNLP